jgi:hypothetical protein
MADANYFATICSPSLKRLAEYPGKWALGLREPQLGCYTIWANILGTFSSTCVAWRSIKTPSNRYRSAGGSTIQLPERRQSGEV